MEKLMQRGKDVFSLKNEEEMDFNDVFGGPPKRFSLQEFGARLSSESEEDKTSSSPWREKPVFGEEVRARRRQNQNQNQQSDEFFNDIFKGAVESYRDRDSSFGSNPGSRIMSPLPPKPDHFPTSLPLPAHFSLPAKVTKGMELPTFGSSSPPLSRFSSRSNDEEVHPHQSHSSYKSCFIVSDDSDTRNKGDNAFNHFHFSIYKWAGKGVPMLNDFKSTINSNSNGRRMDIRSSNFTKTKSAPAVDKQETKDTVVPPKKETEFVNPQLKKTIHAFLNEDDHQEMKDKKPKTPRVDDGMKNRKVENSSSLKLGEMNEKKSVRKKNVKEFVKQEGESGDVAAKDNKSGHVSFKVVEDLKKHQPVQPSQPSTTPNIKSSAETLHTDSKENADDPLDDNFMVEEIFDAQENAADSESSDDTKAIDAKIRQWSVGKKGNIRSLLSTLQYVLWAESGWKAVPLVDLIEANSVKRAYQKALLRLHPDKLQQKGASFHHKYTAEKVFDILQEAWDHFNTSSLSM